MERTFETRPATPPQTVRIGEHTVETDVLVVGGGPAGIGAALGASQTGARVVLAERYGFLGGMATAALVMPLASYSTADLSAARAGDTSLFPSDAGAVGRPVIAGVVERFVARLVEEGGAWKPTAATGYVVPFDAETFKWVAQVMAEESSVELLHHAYAVDTLVEEDDRVGGVVFATKSGLMTVRASVTVDCTGDGDVAAAAGAPFDCGREEDGLMQPMTLMLRVGGFDRDAFERYVAENPGQWFGVYGLWGLVGQAIEEGDSRPPRDDVLLFATTRPGEVTVNSTRVHEASGIDALDLSRAEREGRRQARDVVHFLQKRVPGFERSFLAQSGSQIGVRETRRIRGLYTLTGEDVLSARRFGDSIALNAYPVDIHDPLGGGTKLRRLPPGEAYGIPLRCLIPAHHDGLLVAGRCISTSHVALSSVRVMPPCMATGQAAGVCAALSVASKRAPRDVPHAEVQAELAQQGAILSV